jgi:hypothetical protein
MELKGVVPEGMGASLLFGELAPTNFSARGPMAEGLEGRAGGGEVSMTRLV